jgi:tetratricopeptide (TPR) repeat protein
MDQLKLIEVRGSLARVGLLLPLLLALVCSWYALCWYAGNTVVEYSPGLEEGALDTARFGMRLAPSDPLAHWTVAGLERRSLDPKLAQDALRHYEEAAALSPNDYRLWMDLGVAREQAGDIARGEKALRRAVELAPAYADPRWFLGNLLLRAGRREEAFAELNRAAQANPATYQSQIFNVAWQVYGGNAAEMRRAVGEAVQTRVALAAYMAGRGRLDDALDLWSSLDEASRKTHREVGQQLMLALTGEKRYRAALGLFKDLSGTAGASDAGMGQFQNGGFESELATGASASANPFGWQLKSAPQAQVALDQRHAHGGTRALRVTFNAPGLLNFDNISQLVVVDPSTQYRLECYVRTDDLKSASAPLLEVVDSLDGSVLATGGALPIGKNDWQPFRLDFKTGARTEAVTVRTGRAPCAVEGGICPIFGTIWYDDFNLQRAGAQVARGGTGARAVDGAGQDGRAP